MFCAHSFIPLYIFINSHSFFNAFSFGQTHTHTRTPQRHTHLYLMLLFVYPCLSTVFIVHHLISIYFIQISVCCIANRIGSNCISYCMCNVYPSIFCASNDIILISKSFVISCGSSRADSADRYIAVEHAFCSFLHNAKLCASLFHFISFYSILLLLKQGRPVSVV